MKHLLKAISLILILTGLIVSIYFLYKLSFQYKSFGDDLILLPETGQVGDFIGGVIGTMFSLAGFFIIVLTLLEQTSFASRERFENKFFELLKLHRENVRELEKDNIPGRKEFQKIFMQFLDCRNEMKPVFRKTTEDSIYEPKYLNEIKSKLKLTNPDINLVSLAKINLPYLITFYGVGSDGKQAIYDLLEDKFKKNFLRDAIEYIAMKPIKSSKYFSGWESISKLQPKNKLKVASLIRRLRNNEEIGDGILHSKAKDIFYQSNYLKYYGGHQYELSHYFRHLFQTFKYINIQSNMSETEKYFFAKTLRAQLSTYEQFLLFINSLSTLGLVWDLVPECDDKKHIFFLKSISTKRLITKFNLIKNIPGKEIFGISFREYYPDVEYEHIK